MIYEHEIPTGSKLYFGDSAKLKREIERVASEFFYNAAFEEIVTPFFSYHQHQSIDEKELLRFSDEQNHIVSLRADSTMDAVRLITFLLGRFYFSGNGFISNLFLNTQAMRSIK